MIRVRHRGTRFGVDRLQAHDPQQEQLAVRRRRLAQPLEQGDGAGLLGLDGADDLLLGGGELRRGLGDQLRRRVQVFEQPLRRPTSLDTAKQAGYFRAPELVEEALKKIACDRLNGIFLNGTAGVQFTMYELRQELKRRGHGMHLHALIRSLTICRRAQVAIRSASGSPAISVSRAPEANDIIEREGASLGAVVVERLVPARVHVDGRTF